MHVPFPAVLKIFEESHVFKFTQMKSICQNLIDVVYAICRLYALRGNFTVFSVPVFGLGEYFPRFERWRPYVAIVLCSHL